MSTSGSAAHSLTVPVSVAQGGTGQATAALARGPSGLNIDQIHTVADAAYNMAVTDRTIVFTSITASRVVNLVAASTYDTGAILVIKDRSGSVTPLITITPTAHAGDTIDGAATINPIMLPFDQCALMSDGVSNWHVLDAPRNYGNCNGQSTNHFALPNNVWTQVPLGTELVTDGSAAVMHPLQTWSATTITTGALPQGSIQVNAPSGGTPASSGFIVITGPPGAGIDTIVKYTGYNSGTNTFTGCTQGTGTLAAGQTVKAANDQIILPNNSFWALVGIVTFPAAGTTGVLGVRFFAGAAGLFAGGTQQIGNPNAQVTLSISTTFNEFAGASNLGVQAFQTSGGTITIPIDGIEAPLCGGNFTTLR